MSTPETRLAQVRALLDRGQDEEAVPLLLELAKAGIVEAQFSLGLAYRDGRGVPPDAGRATMWLRRAAVAGDVEAQYHFAKLALDRPRGAVHGLSTGALAIEWFQRAADNGHVRAASWLGRALLEGRGGQSDPEAAVVALRQATKGGDLDATYLLGLMTAEGLGVSADPEEASRLVHVAAEAGHVDACRELGRWYAHGILVTADLTVAIDWMRRSSESGDISAAAMLGSWLEEAGELEEAWLWLTRAAENGHLLANDRLQQLSNQLTTQQKQALRETAHKAAWTVVHGTRLQHDS